MNPAFKPTPSKTIIAEPSARRCGSDDQQLFNSKIAQLDLLVDQVKSSEAFSALSDRILSFANAVETEVKKLTPALGENDMALIEKSGQRIAALASEAGASDLIRSSYQLLITIRQGKSASVPKLVTGVEEEFKKLKAKFRLA